MGTELPFRDLRGQDYLDVKYRLVWFREEKPEWTIETYLTDQEPDSCLAKAVIKDGSGRIIQTGHKFEDKKGFADYREKAETGAVGRALAMIGYGTQFASDFDEGDRIVDAPIERHLPNPVITKMPINVITPFSNDEEEPYRVPFGKKYKGMTLDEIGPDGCRGYVTYLEDSARKGSKPMGHQAQDFVNRATRYVVEFETADDLPF